MKPWLAYAATFGAAFLAMLVFTPLAMAAARRLGFLDRPNTALKRHEKPVPYLGGLAIFASFSLALTGSKFFLFPHPTGLWPAALDVFKGVYAIWLGALLSTLLGLVDDARALSPSAKFGGQLVAALALVWCGIHIRFVPQPWLAVVLTLLWVVGVSNAMNFVDILDGLAAGGAGIAALGFFLFSQHVGRDNDSIAALALAGACAGFLVFNFAPARIYMGDAGSMMLGFVLAAISLNETYSRQNLLAVLSPLLILSLPVFDVLLMSVIRTRKGIPPWKGSPDHIPLRLRHLGFSKRATALILYAATAALSLLAYGASFLPGRDAVLVWALVGLSAFLAGAWLMGIPMPHDRPGEGKPARHRRR